MPDIWESVAILAKLTLYIGIFGAVGLTIIRAVFADLVSALSERIKLQIILLAGLGLIAAIFGFMLRGAALTGGRDGITDPEMLGLLWQTPVGDALVFRITGMALIFIGAVSPRFGSPISLVGGGIALWSFVQIGHVPELEITGVRLLLFLHLFSIAFWIGVLGPLRALARQQGRLADAAELGHRFGQVAMGIVPGLILAGFVMGAMLLGDPLALLTTAYGQTLLIKLLLVGGLLTLAAANKLRIVPAMRAGDERAARGLIRSIEGEMVFIFAVLFATATLTSVLPVPG